MDEGNLQSAVLDSLKKTEHDTVAQSRGDGKFVENVTNQHLIELIQDFQNAKQQQSEHPVDQQSPTAINIQPKSTKLKKMVTITLGDEDVSDSKATSVNHEQKRLLIEFLISVIDFEAPIRHCYFI